MSHTYTAIRAHVVFSTSERRPVITPEIQPRLWDYIGGIGRNHKVPIHAVGGGTDHVHVLLSIPPAMDLAKIVQDLKAYSSKWINEERLLPEPFAWQRGYGGFSVSASNADAVETYIRTQPEHHAKHSFEDEFRALLVRHGVQFDERYIFG